MRQFVQPIANVTRVGAAFALLLLATRIVHAEEPVLFETSVQAIFRAKCSPCHSDRTAKASLNLSTPAGILKGSESGEILDAETPADSLLLQMIADGLMPPEDEPQLTEEEVAAIRQWVTGGARFAKSSATDQPQVTQHDVLPILYLRCTVCHGLRRREAELDLRTKASMLAGGKSGPAIVPGDPASSLLLKRIHAGDMPPRRELVAVSIKVISDSEIETLTKWIAAGAPEVPAAPDVPAEGPDRLVSDEDRDFWAFKPPQRHAAPTVRQADQVVNFIDAFLLAKLEAEGLTLAPAADRATLIRRATLDLTGLLPEPEEVQQFVADPDPHAYENLIERLLASPHYGERWGRHWLDVAGYSESEGVQHSDKPRPQVYRYRDYVIRAFNDDKPYDRFLLEQIAGDELADYESAEAITDELYDNLVATGFLRLGVDGTFANITNFVPDRLDMIADEIDLLCSTIMGLTMKCARCHSHKFDPIPQRDYYRLAAVFKGALDEHDWLSPERKSGAPGTSDRYLPYVTTAERTTWQANEQRIDAAVQAARQQLSEKQQSAAQKLVEQRLAALPDVLRDDLRAILATPDVQRTDVQKYLAEKFEKQLRIDAEELKKLDPEFQKAAADAEAEIKKLESERQPEPLIRALWDRGEPSPSYLLRRGDYLNPGPLITPGVPAALTRGDYQFNAQPPWPGAKKTGRRLAFARWLTQPDHPLTARVMVNRIWRHHFGQGIVQSLGNFGRTGSPPSHPELLDRLAVEFAASGWSIKQMHRTMMLSAAYRQQSSATPDRIQRDPNNLLLSHMPLRRMDAEALRDTLLQVARRLDRTMNGPPVGVNARADGLITAAEGEQGFRRSIYVLQRRRQVPTILENFDLPQMNPNCIERGESVVAPQALHLLNNGLVYELAGHFAARVRQEAGDDRQRQIERAYLITSSRPPTAEELAVAQTAITDLTAAWEQNAAKTDKPKPPEESALASFCHALINSAAYSYID